MLDNPVGKTSKRPIIAKRRGMSAKRQREMGAFTIDPSTCTYAKYISLHMLWTQYITDISGPSSTITSLQAKIVKADFHGAIFTVVRTKCPSFLGIKGIVLQETENMFRIVTELNQLKILPKLGNVFEFSYGNIIVTIYGSQIRYRACERAVRKFKNKDTISL